MSGQVAWTAGHAFHTPSASPDGGHLWGVFSPPFQGDVFIANVTTLRRHSDRSCLLHAGDHPRIRHPSCINYADSKVVALARLQGLRSLSPAPRFDDALVARVVSGALRSDESPESVKRFLRALASEGPGPDEAVHEAVALVYV
jgi:hypothetical protein